MSDRQRIFGWAERGLVTDLRAALIAAGVTPQAADWRTFLDRLLLWSGAAALAAAVVFFIAYNWQDLGKLAKFGLLQVLLVAAVAGYWRLGPERAAGKASLFTACVVTGALLAFFGQTYQTGADTWQLFGVWAAMIAPWVAIARFAALWLFWIALLNLAITLYFTAFGGLFGFVFATEHQAWTLFVFNTVALVAWELAARRIAWLDERWAARVLAFASGTAVTLLVLHAIFEWREASGIALAVYPVWLACAYAAYRHWRRDVFVLAGGCFSAIVVITTFLTKHVITGRSEAGGFLLIALAVIAMAGASGWWLRQLAAEDER